MYPGAFADRPASSPAVVMAGSGESLSYAELDDASLRLAELFRARGLVPGDHVAVMLENRLEYFEIFWGTLRAGLYLTPVNWHLTSDEAGYIVEDCGAKAFITSGSLAAVVADLGPYLEAVSLRIAVGDPLDGFDSYAESLANHEPHRPEDEPEGSLMFYSSGTTGRPKGIKPPLSGAPFGTAPGMLVALIQGVWGFGEDTVYLCPAPLYHAAPLGWSTAVQRLGGTVVVMERFDPIAALDLIEAHQVTHAQFVPTHFIRMLKLDQHDREGRDLSSLRVAVHAAAPCPVEVKERMLEWWGPIIHEYYAGSEGNGFTAVGPEDWLTHRGTVGIPLFGVIHILDEDGNELGAGEVGEIWFESPTKFEYHNDAEKTAGAFNDRGWSSLGDIGHLDDDGFLYLTDRVAHMIISGGVNIYPQEIEDLLALHPAVEDLAVIGVPDADMGEQVKAVVQLVADRNPTTEVAEELLSYCREHLSSFKCPRTVDFVDSLPRMHTGKLMKRELRATYWPA